MAPYTINHSHPLHKPSFLLEVMQMFWSPKLDKLLLKIFIHNVAFFIHNHSATEVFSTSHSESLCNHTSFTEQSWKTRAQQPFFWLIFQEYFTFTSQGSNILRKPPLLLYTDFLQNCYKICSMMYCAGVQQVLKKAWYLLWVAVTLWHLTALYTG
jgi:hypothetical protein